MRTAIFVVKVPLPDRVPINIMRQDIKDGIEGYLFNEAEVTIIGECHEQAKEKFKKI